MDKMMRRIVFTIWTVGLGAGVSLGLGLNLLPEKARVILVVIWTVCVSASVGAGILCISERIYSRYFKEDFESVFAGLENLVLHWRMTFRFSIIAIPVMLGILYMKNYWHDPIGRQVTWEVGMGGKDDISDLLAEILPDNMKDAAQALHKAGFRESRESRSRQWKISDLKGVRLGPVHLEFEPRVIGQEVQENNTTSSKNETTEGRRYYRRIDRLITDRNITIFLFKHKDGTLSVMGISHPIL